MINKKLVLCMFFIFGIFISISFSSAYVQSSFASQNNNAIGLGIFSGAQSLKVDESMCKEGTDFLIQIGPLSCTPTVVRSDLLEEENVNVYCQLSATQINPFVDVKAIDYLTFTGDYPKEVSGLGYHPAQAALGYTQNTGLQGSAVLNNLGYVMVTLKQQPNESALTNCEKTVLGGEVCWVEGNLTATLRYDIENAFGVGNAVFYLPVMSDEEWQQNYVQYSFWEGRGYLRANAVGESEASVSIYSDDSVASGLSQGERKYNLAKYSSNINLKTGTASDKIFLPGLSPCLASLELTLNGVENPETRATLKINNDYVEVAEREKFLENRCTLLSLDKKGVNSHVKIQCKEDEKQNSFDLRIFPKIKLSVGGKTSDYSVGDWLYNSDDGRKSVYLGYIGTIGDTTNVGDLYAYLVALPVYEDKLTDSEISSVVSHAESIRSSSKSGAKTFDVIVDSLKVFSGAVMQVGKWAITGESFYFVQYNGKESSVEGSLVSLKGFSNPEENGFMTLKTENYTLTKEINTADRTQYSFEENGKKSDMFLLKSTSLTEAPSYSIQISPATTLGTFYGEDCTKHENCLKYALSLSTINVSTYKYFFDGIVSAEIIPSENKLVITRTSFSEFADEGEYKKNYENAMKDFETIVNSFPKEVEKANSIETFGEQALYEEIFLANSIEQKKTMLDLCKKFEEDYPNSYRSLELCKNDLKISSSEVAVKDVTINGITKSISFEEIKEPSINDYSATVIVQGPNGKTQSFDLRKNKQVYLSGFRVNESQLQTTEYIMLTDLGTDSASIKLSLGDQNFFNTQFVSDTYSLKKGISIRQGGYTFTVTNINLQKVAKVSVHPRTDFAESQTNFKFKIGIEKRNTLLKLSPDKAQEKINSLNSSIAEWQKASDALYTVVKDMKAACLVAGTSLTLKNLIANSGGKSIARQEVMTGKGGWDEKCTELVSAKKYKSMDDCFLDNGNAIENDVNNLYNVMDYQNNEIKNIENANMQEGSKNSVNTSGFITDYSKQVLATLNSLPEEEKKNLNMENIGTVLNTDGWNNNKYTIDQLKEVELYSLYLKSYNNDPTAKTRLSSVLSDIETNSQNYVKIATRAGQMEINPDKITWIGLNKNVQKYAYEGLTAGNTKNTNLPSTIPADNPIAVVQTEQGTYTLVLDNSGKTKNYPVKINEIVQTVDGKEKKVLQWQIYDSKGVLIEGEENKNIIDKFSSSVFEVLDATSYKNKYKASYGSSSVLLKYYETSPFKGFPAVVPFDLTNGWYAGIKTPQTSYDASGVVKSFWLCNVAENGIEEFQLEGFGDDICELFNLNTGQKYTNFPGLSESDTYNLVTRADNAIQVAQKAHTDGVNSVNIGDKAGKVKVGEPAVQTPASQCTDFMSAKDCSLLFNLCDPVICPSSRCNLGGNYPVQDVIQSGIIGSIALCYPNAKWNGGDVYIPVCLTGIQAGIDSWVSIQKSYRDCLQTNLDTGETVGICDEINSIYTCEFFWKQALPIINSALPKLLGIITGQNKKGGGEYQGVSSALDNAKNSVDYFKQYYAANSYRAFKVRSTEEAGTELCSTFVSLAYPDSGSFLDNLIEPDSPVQFTGKFDEILLTTVTNPPTSQYKVYYHIYAGKDSGVYYQVYLRGSGSSYYQDTSQRRIVNSSYIERGGYASATVDFTAPSGYKELCIVVNGQEECGFKEVSTSFAVNYVSDLYLAEQTTKTNITTEKECISGTTSFYSLLNLNVESTANSLINPELYAQGIIRICATDDPGAGTDASAGTESARWKQVGYCGNNKIGCWIDTNSVKDVIKAMNIQNQALNEISNNALGYLSEDYLDTGSFSTKIDEIKKETSDTKRIELIGEIFNKVFFNNQKAQLFFLRGKSYSNLAIAEYSVILDGKLKAEEAAKAKAEAEAGAGTVVYFIDDKATKIVYYKFSNNQWYWSLDKVSWKDTSTSEGVSMINQQLIAGLVGKNEADGKGLIEFEMGTLSGGEISEATPLDKFNKKYISPIFEFEDGTSTSNLCYRFFNGIWHWTGDCTGVKNENSASGTAGYGTVSVDLGTGQWVNVNVLQDNLENKPTQTNINFITQLQGKNYLDGLQLLMDRTIKNAEGGFFFSADLTTDNSGMSHDKIFSVDMGDKFYFKYTSPNWLESSDNKIWLQFSDYKNINLIKDLAVSLEGATFYGGAAILFDPTSADVRAVFGSTTSSTGTTTTCTAGQTKCVTTTYYTCVNNAWISQGLVDGKCGYTSPAGVCNAPEVYPEAEKLTDARQKVLFAATALDGTPALKGSVIKDYDLSGGINCFDSTLHVYNKAGVNFHCAYSDELKKAYISDEKTVLMGITKNSNGNVIFQVNPNTAKCNLVGLSEKDKLNNIKPGDIISIIYNPTAGHDIIFIKWINENSHTEAQIFDWINIDANGNKVFGYRTIDLSDGQYSVYMYWEPVIL
jgi:hypothetical protein